MLGRERLKSGEGTIFCLIINHHVVAIHLYSGMRIFSLPYRVIYGMCVSGGGGGSAGQEGTFQISHANLPLTDHLPVSEVVLATEQ